MYSLTILILCVFANCICAQSTYPITTYEYIYDTYDWVKPSKPAIITSTYISIECLFAFTIILYIIFIIKFYKYGGFTNLFKIALIYVIISIVCYIIDMTVIVNYFVEYATDREMYHVLNTSAYFHLESYYCPITSDCTITNYTLELSKCQSIYTTSNPTNTTSNPTNTTSNPTNTTSNPTNTTSNPTNTTILVNCPFGSGCCIGYTCDSCAKLIYDNSPNISKCANIRKTTYLTYLNTTNPDNVSILNALKIITINYNYSNYLLNQNLNFSQIINQLNQTIRGYYAPWDPSREYLNTSLNIYIQYSLFPLYLFVLMSIVVKLYNNNKIKENIIEMQILRRGP
jgi:hypothetical protein